MTAGKIDKFVCQLAMLRRVLRHASVVGREPQATGARAGVKNYNPNPIASLDTLLVQSCES